MIYRSKRTLFMLAPVVLGIAAAELWFRVFPLEDGYATNAGIVEPADPERIWKLRPIAAGPLATNELGLRDGPYRDDAQFKILLLGDSVSWGNGIDDTQSLFASRLEQNLNAQHRLHSYEVINAGVPGYSTFQELAYLRNEGLRLGPDLIVLQFCLNDVVERYRSLAGLGGNRSFLGVDTRHAVRGVYGTLLRNSRAFEAAARAAQSVVRDRELFYVRNLFSDRLDDELRDAWARVDRELDGVFETARRSGLPLLLLIAPYRSQLKNPGAMRQPQEHLAAWAHARGVPTVDVLAYMQLLSADAAEPLFNDESHFSAAGHAFVAELLQLPVERAISLRYPARFGAGGHPGTAD